MSPEDLVLLIGTVLVIASFCFIAYVSVVAEALRKYAISALFDAIPEEDEPRQRKFEELTRRDDEFLQACSIGRITGFVLHLCGWIMIAASNGVLFRVDELFTTGWHGIENLRLPTAAGLSALSLIVSVLVIPPAILRHKEEAALLVLLPTFAVIATIFRPLTLISSLVGRFGARIEGVAHEETPEESFQEDLADSLEEAEREGVLDEDEREMIHNVVELGQTPATKAMIPRTDMICVNLDDGLNAALELAVDHGHSRIPVFEGDRDHIVGVFYTRDLVPTWADTSADRGLDLRKLIRPAHFWPETIALDELLRKMREDRLKIAILLDEYGGTAGMITLEDILEEIVGDIHDEYDEGERERAHRAITPFTHGIAEADADVDIDEVNRVLSINLAENPDYNSVGGLILHEMGHLPGVGESVVAGNFVLTVLDADERRIKRVSIASASSDTHTELKR